MSLDQLQAYQAAVGQLKTKPERELSLDATIAGLAPEAYQQVAAPLVSALDAIQTAMDRKQANQKQIDVALKLLLPKSLPEEPVISDGLDLEQVNGAIKQTQSNIDGIRLAMQAYKDALDAIQNVEGASDQWLNRSSEYLGKLQQNLSLLQERKSKIHTAQQSILNQQAYVARGQEAAKQAIKELYPVDTSSGAVNNALVERYKALGVLIESTPSGLSDDASVGAYKSHIKGVQNDVGQQLIDAKRAEIKALAKRINTVQKALLGQLNLEELITLRSDLGNLAPLDPAVQSSTIPSATVEPRVDNDVSESAVQALKDYDSMLDSLIGAKKSILEARKASLVDNNQATATSQIDATSQTKNNVSVIQDNASEINGNWSIASVRQGIRYRDLLTNALRKGDTHPAIQKDQSVTAIQKEQVITTTKLHDLTSNILYDLNPSNESALLTVNDLRKSRLSASLFILNQKIHPQCLAG